MYVLSIVVCPFVYFLLAIVLSLLLRYTDSDYPFGIFKLFLDKDLALHRKLTIEQYELHQKKKTKKKNQNKNQKKNPNKFGVGW